MVCHHLVKVGGHRYCSSRGIRVLDCLVIYNHFHNILRLFDILSNFFSPQVKRTVIVSNKYGIFELPHELPNNLRLRILRNYEISGKFSKFIE